MFIIYLTFCVCLHSVTPFMVWSCPEWHWSTLVCKLSMTPLSGLTMRSLTITQGNVIRYVPTSSPRFLKTRNALNTYWNSKLFQRYLKPKNWTEFKHLKMRIKRGNCDHHSIAYNMQQSLLIENDKLKFNDKCIRQCGNRPTILDGLCDTCQGFQASVRKMWGVIAPPSERCRRLYWASLTLTPFWSDTAWKRTSVPWRWLL